MPSYLINVVVLFASCECMKYINIVFLLMTIALKRYFFSFIIAVMKIKKTKHNTNEKRRIPTNISHPNEIKSLFI